MASLNLLPLRERSVDILLQLYDVIDATAIRTAFSYCHRNQVQTAKLLGMSRNVLRAKLIRYGLL